MIQGIFEIIQQDYVNDEEIKFIADLVKVLFLTFDTFIVLNEFDLLIYFFLFYTANNKRVKSQYLYIII